MSNTWKSRIVGHDKVAADQLLANPFNHRRHPQKQRDVVNASINELGFVKSVLVNITTGRIVDGHERVMQALQRGDATLVDVEYVELSEEEERKALLLLDASSELATVDGEALALLVEDLTFQDESLSTLVVDLTESTGVFSVGDVDAPSLASGDREPFRQMTFTVHDSQFEEIEKAMKAAKAKGGAASSVNENGNGNALAYLCTFFNDQN